MRTRLSDGQETKTERHGKHGRSAAGEARRSPVKPRGRPAKEYHCADCGAVVGRTTTRCHACDSKSRRGIRPDNVNAQRIVAAAESGKHKTMASIAKKVGVSRERVRQVLNATGHTNFGSRHVYLQWRCPDCRDTIKMTATRLRGLSHMLAHCRDCAKNYCRRGHLTTHARCRVCERKRRRRIVEVRTCRECGNDLEISQGVRYQISIGRTRGDFHFKCYLAYIRREGRPIKKPLP